MNITLVGVGMGSSSGMTREAFDALAAADVIVGAARLLESLPGEFPAKKIAEAIPEKAAAAVTALRDCERVCVALSGDVGFYSGAKKLATLLARFQPLLVPGISAPQYLAAKLGRPWQDQRLVSAHGVPCDVAAEVLNHPSVFFLTGGDCAAADIARALVEADLPDAAVTVGENLSAPEERIRGGSAEEMADIAFAPLSVVLVDNQRTFARRIVSPGIADAEFVRGDAPMTKREVRVQALSLLELRPDSVVYDVGAGTGSVAVEAALTARRGRVFAMESEAAAFALLRENRRKFGALNVTPMLGAAPEAFKSLPPPDAVFIGGSRGRMRVIIEALTAKNPAVRIVAAAIALETLSSVMDAMTALEIRRLEVVQISAARAAVRGKYHMLEAMNPVFLVSGGGADDGN